MSITLDWKVDKANCSMVVHKGSRSKSAGSQKLFWTSLYVLFVSILALSGKSGFVPESKDLHLGLRRMD